MQHECVRACVRLRHIDRGDQWRRNQGIGSALSGAASLAKKTAGATLSAASMLVDTRTEADRIRERAAPTYGLCCAD